MSKKDRVAIVFTLLWLTVTIGIGIDARELLYGLGWGFIPLIIYWGYRFIQDNISFLRKN